MHTRRDFIKRAAMLSGAAGFAAGVPEAIQKAFAIEPAVGSTWKDAEHVVILMQENRSFDHALGSLQGVRGFNDPRALRQANGNSIFLQTDKDGNTFAPWRLDIKDTKITWMGSISHARNTQVDAWNQGFHNNWIESKRPGHAGYRDTPITMGHYTREDIPFYYVLADAFTVCDQNYCGVMTSTTPNRSLLWTGTIRDKQDPHSSVYMRNPEFRNLKWKTFPERLHEAGISFKVYTNEVNARGTLVGEDHQWLGNVGNILENFDAYNSNLSDANTAEIQQQLVTARQQLTLLQNSPLGNDVQADREAEILQLQQSIKSFERQLKRNGGNLSKLTPDERDLHVRAFTTNAGDPNYLKTTTITYEEDGKPVKMLVPAGDVLYQFRKDVKENKLPTVSWLAGPGKFSDHPSHPMYGPWFVSEVMNILTHNPEVWKKTIFILTYDENDGYFDHCPSFVAADPSNRGTGRASAGIDTAIEYTYAPDEIAQGIKAKDARSGPIGQGFRVPMIVASPWSRGGYVNSELFDQTCTIQFVEKFVEAKFGKQVKETNLSEFRRAIVGDLTSCFRPFDGKTPELAFLDRDKWVESIYRARNKEMPNNFIKLTPEQIKKFNENPRMVDIAAKQEPGIRPANALPYELYCEGDFVADRKVFGLAMRAGNTVHGERSAGSPFNVYVRNTAKQNTNIARGENNQNMFVATYVVKAGDTLQEGLPTKLFQNEQYHIDVHGPNGFYREFKGDASGSPLTTRCVYDRNASGLSGNVEARVKNNSAKPVTVHVIDNSYKTGAQTKELAPGQQVSLKVDCSKSHGWYDFTVRADGSNAQVRYAGRVETGRESFTDPLMGGVV
ncbi:MAG: phospholipase C, phosphocholine-specific [Acidobacteria bacterium]|nr:phospholipase C, phosphocholine-specific [Acidobacteriota bacterium]